MLLSNLLMRAALVTLMSMSVAAAATAAPMEFGVDVAGADKAAAKGMPLKYASLWAGSWNQKYGWGGVEDQLRKAKANGMTPVVQWWYWGDDISPSCVEQGCNDRYQQVWKDKATWKRLSGELAAVIDNVYGAQSNAVVIIETEFNKGGIESYEAFDGYLVEHARLFQARGQKVVIGFGNWGQSQWKTFDRAAGSADYLGIQVLYSSVRESNTYMTGAQVLIDGAKRLQSMFGKPTFVTDFAFSSYPEPNYVTYQDLVVQDIMARLPELKAAGVQGMVWRMLTDDPKFDTANYHGQAERHWGLLRADGSEKPSFSSFMNGIAADRQGTAPPPPSPAPTPAPAPAPSATIDVWWPTANAVVTGTQPFKALLKGHALTDYTMYWKVDGGQENLMGNSNVDYPHKEVSVNVSGWNWRGQGPYEITFVARDLNNRVLAQKSVSVTVR